MKNDVIKSQEPTTKNDLGVDWDELKRKIFMEVGGGTDDKWLRYADVCDNISDSIDEFKADLPSVTPQEPKTGYWIERHDDWGNGIITDRKYKCSVCHGKHIDSETGEWHEVFDYKYPFCPNCGAKMVEPQESENV